MNLPKTSFSRLSFFPRLFIYLLFGLVVLVLIAEGGYYFWQSRLRKKVELSPVSLQERIKKAGYEIYHQANPSDTVGRTIFYQKREEGTFEKTGLLEVVLGEVSYRYIAGSFVRWEDISGSKDKYLILKNPGVEEKGSLLPPVRIGFEGNNQTWLGVENLDYGPDNLEVYSSADLGSVLDWQVDLEKLIQPGDAVAATFWQEIGGGELQDENGNLIARRLLIRRFSGVEQLEKELGREIEAKALW